MELGNVAISIKIMPDSPHVDLEKIKNDINKKLKIQDSKIEPIAFGLKALKILIVMPDKGGTEQIENEIRKIKGVAEVEIESVTLV